MVGLSKYSRRCLLVASSAIPANRQSANVIDHFQISKQPLPSRSPFRHSTKNSWGSPFSEHAKASRSEAIRFLLDAAPQHHAAIIVPIGYILLYKEPLQSLQYQF